MMPTRCVYLDNSATTRPSDAVVAAMLQVLTENWHNPSALYQPAMQAEKLMNAGAQAVTLGPRILRTETAAVASVTAALQLWGDI